MDSLMQCTSQETVSIYPVLPEPVAGLTATSTSVTISLHWTYQSSGSSPRTGVEVEITRGGATVPGVMVGGGATSLTLSSLPPLTAHTLTVFVVSAVGRSAAATVQVSTLSPSQSPCMPHACTCHVTLSTTCRSPSAYHNHIPPSLHLIPLPTVGGT